jgi:hypothetical protein
MKILTRVSPRILNVICDVFVVTARFEQASQKTMKHILNPTHFCASRKYFDGGNRKGFSCCAISLHENRRTDFGALAFQTDVGLFVDEIQWHFTLVLSAGLWEARRRNVPS